MTRRLFGDLLRETLAGTSVSALARALSIDRSSIYHWLRNECVSGLGINYLTGIASYLRLDHTTISRLRQAQIAATSGQSQPATRKRAARAKVDSAVTCFLEHAQTRPLASVGEHAPAGAASAALPLQGSVPRGTRKIMEVIITLFNSTPARHPEIRPSAG